MRVSGSNSLCKVNAYEQPNIPISCYMSEQGYEQKYVKEALFTLC